MILEILQDALYEIFDVDTEDISPDTDFYDDLGADSLDMLEVWYILQEECDLTEQDKENMADFETVGQVINYISGKN